MLYIKFGICSSSVAGCYAALHCTYCLSGRKRCQQSHLVLCDGPATQSEFNTPVKFPALIKILSGVPLKTVIEG